ncbi:MAG: DUF3106 domain-containing protein [Limisphaerales bacterium]
MRAHILPVWLIGCVCGALLAQAHPLDAATPDAKGIGPPGLPPLPQSPVEELRQLVAMKATDRERALATKTEPVRQWWRRKLQEYDGLQPEERGVRLRAVQFRWTLLSLMKTSPARRGEKLDGLPEADRKYIEFRLQQWDALPATVQNDILENEITVRYFLRLEPSAPADEAQALQWLPPDDRRQLEDRLARWRAWQPDHREKMLDRFSQFFELTRDERQRILGILPDPQRRQTEQNLKTIEQLPRTQRQQVIESLRKFAAMTSGQREQFLENAARWEAMSPREREAWLSLVRRLPPLPPGLHRSPPLPPGLTPPLPFPTAARAAAGPTN